MARQPLAALRLAVLAIAALSQAKAIVYVTAGGGGPLDRGGASWVEGYSGAGSPMAIEQAVGDEVWVARGDTPEFSCEKRLESTAGFWELRRYAANETRPRTSPFWPAGAAPIRSWALHTSIRLEFRSSWVQQRLSTDS